MYFEQLDRDEYKSVFGEEAVETSKERLLSSIPVSLKDKYRGQLLVEPFPRCFFPVCSLCCCVSVDKAMLEV
jgi:hypothetical protein